MDDLKDKIHGERSFLEKIARIIPGYSGYKERLERQEADKMLRDYLAQQLDVQMGYLRDLIDEMTRSMKIKSLDLVDRPLKKLEKLRDRIRFADHGYTGLFEPLKVDIGVLNKMYEFDNSLLEFVVSLDGAIKETRALVEDDARLQDGLKTLHQLVDQTDIRFNERENFLLNK
jgi:hypothetical protein